MPVPFECESLARSIQSLVAERTALGASLAALQPRERWRAMGTIGNLDLRIEGERRRFETCLNDHHAAYRASIVIFDTSDVPPPPGPRIAKLWRKRDPIPELLEEVPITDGALTFTRYRDADGPIGVTIEETGDPRIKGPDLRSGWLPELPGTSLFDPDGRIEVVLRAATISVDEWGRWLGTVEMPSESHRRPSAGAGQRSFLADLRRNRGSDDSRDSLDLICACRTILFASMMAVSRSSRWQRRCSTVGQGPSRYDGEVAADRRRGSTLKKAQPYLPVGVVSVRIHQHHALPGTECGPAVEHGQRERG
jgi:hypothetical protein